jgi:lipopolysaccharide/colanic/teichoic acid biosynthesis glycosyltransferase
MGLSGLGASFLGILVAALSKQLCDEFKAWTPWAMDQIVKLAIRGLPKNQRERFDEEWRSHINDVPGEVGKFWVAFGFIVASRKISSDFRRGLNPLSLAKRATKRTFDILIAGSMLFLLAPLFVATSFVVLLDGGPVFLRLPRVGINGKTFNLYKFRSVRFDADATSPYREQQHIHTTEKDSVRPIFHGPAYFTKFGKFLFRTGLDSLPLLINILKGEMSFVGLPPYKPEQGNLYVDGSHFRSSVRPGVTGLWQITGRHPTVDERIDFERWYAQNYSIWLDIVFLFKQLLSALKYRDGS